jgi:hypothetical protein
MPTTTVYFPSASIILIKKQKISSLKMVIYHQKENGRVKLEWGVKTIPLVSICMTWRDLVSTFTFTIRASSHWTTKSSNKIKAKMISKQNFNMDLLRGQDSPTPGRGKETKDE